MPDISEFSDEPGKVWKLTGPNSVSSPGADCPRHGGPWGGDETCQHCTDGDGNPRPRTSPGPLGPGATT